MLMDKEKKELNKLRRMSAGTPVKLQVRRGTSNVKIFGAGFSPTYKQLNAGAETVVKARVKLYKKRR